MGEDVHGRERRFPKKRPAKAEILAAGWPEGDGRLFWGCPSLKTSQRASQSQKSIIWRKTTRDP